MPKAKTKTVFGSSVNGRFITTAKAMNNPATHEKEPIRFSSKKK